MSSRPRLTEAKLSNPNAGAGSAEHRLAHLDLVRGLAAIAVCAGHIRGFLVVDWHQIKGKATILDYLFYFLTGFGHQAVMVFFVMSGFLVGGSVASSWARGNWSASTYAIHRIARLETVLIPALLFTLFWDALGRTLTNGAGYDGALYQLANSGPSAESLPVNDLVTFLGNASFLMTTVVPVLGTNGPLWSLSNEFWYYVIFPLIWIALLGAGMRKLVCTVTFAVLVTWLPKNIVLLGSIWLLGYAAWYACTKPSFKTFSMHPLWLVTTSLLFLLSLFGSRTAFWFGTDLAVGVATSLLVTALAVRNANGQRTYARVARCLADMSYTLYLFHFPFLSFIWFAYFAPEQFQPDPSGYSLLIFLLSICLAYAYCMWWCFERHSSDVRKYLERWAQETFHRS